ncbi:MAG: SDR family NAD(P)-dependent oxidoreductase [Acidobacteria bacterium]|nr:SDR family NAD(P)-dependent oxidoreductase [Acidobacteriota bacterium]
MTVSEQHVVVTGGASGLGLAFSRHLTGLGARVWALDRDPKALAAAALESKKIAFLACDVGDELQVVENVTRIERESGGITVLVNNAAVLMDQALVSKVGGKVRTHSLSDWNETLQSNLTGTFLMTREVAAAMIRGKRRGGLIVNISSISRSGNPGQTAYSATKGGIDAVTVTWSQELAVYGIRVVGVAPGFVETPMTSRIPPMFLEGLRARTPVGRFGTLDEFARTLQYVIETDYLNGKVLELDGGLRF